MNPTHGGFPMPHSQDFDVVVIGAGPGGCAAAIQCAAAGLRVAVVEGLAFPRYRPGETLHPGVEPLLRQLSVWEEVTRAGFLRHPGIEVAWDAPSEFVPYGADASGPWLGIQAWRATFDQILLQRAADAGACIFQPCRAVRPLVRDGTVVGLVTNKGTLRARFLLDAAGGRHWLAKHCKLKIERYSPLLIARYGYVRGSCPHRDFSPAIHATAKGWTWTAKVKPDVYAWCRLDLTKQAETGKGTPVSDDPPHTLGGLTSIGRQRGADVTWRRVTLPAGRGYMLIGDAAAVLDPASSHGVLHALMSGIMAAHLITRDQKIIQDAGSRYLSSEQAEAAVERAYCMWMRDCFFRDLTRLRERYAALADPPSWITRPIVAEVGRRDFERWP